jgi:transglutaminase-like putative cysteine protease
MNHYLVARILRRRRPRYGWLPFVLLAAALACLALSVLEVEWVPDDGIVVPALAVGFIVAALLAQRPVRPAVAWLILATLGLGLALVLAIDLFPPFRVLGTGAAAVGEYWRLRLALAVDRTAGWWTAVRAGGRSTETIVFTFGLVLAAWFAAAALAWSAYRARRVYLGLTLAGFALAANTFYGQAGLYWVVLFFGLAITAGTYLNYLYREGEWERRGMDYSAEVRTDLLIYTAGVSLGITTLAMGIPAINFRAIAERFQRQEAVIAAEQTMARAFAGVARPRTDEGAADGGGLPRSFLLGDAPELAETVVMTATIRPATDELAAFHWRSVSYDVYTGSGWRRSPEREENVDRDEAIPRAPAETGGRRLTLSQEVNWIYDRRATRYTLGRPVVFSHDVVVMWRGVDDLVGVRGRNNAPPRYTAGTTVVIASPQQLRGVELGDTPPEILARYTTLPSDIPDRVYALARDVAGGASSTLYDRARAIEQFLRQYPYSLDLSPPPADVDIVDYFLFDLQTGFCDYYASAMVVMARAVGLPARLGVGFLQQPPDAEGRQTIRQIDAHSWAEVYFAGFGWVEFEPTAPFAAPEPGGENPAAPAPQATYEPPGSQSVAIPERAPQRDRPWLLAAGLAALAIVAWRLWGRAWRERRAQLQGLDPVRLAYARLEQGAAALGRPSLPEETPAEFTAHLLDAPALAGPRGRALGPTIERLAHLFTVRQYGQVEPTAGEAAAAWAELRGPLRRLIWRRRLGRPAE